MKVQTGTGKGAGGSLLRLVQVGQAFGNKTGKWAVVVGHLPGLMQLSILCVFVLRSLTLSMVKRSL